METEKTMETATEQVTKEQNMTRENIVEQLETLLASETPISELRDQIEALKSAFYRVKHQAEEVIEEIKDEAAETVEEAEEFVNIVQDTLEAKLRELLNTYKEKRAAETAEREAQMAQNLKLKEAIIEQLKVYTENESEDVISHLQHVKELQAEWKDIGKVPPTAETSIQKQYALCLDQFYDLVQIHYDLREYDFKKNLELKTALCLEAEKLDAKENILDAFQALQQLHDEWKNIGPVAREVREEIWERFKAASTVINKKHQDHFTALHAQEEANQAQKEQLLAQLKTIDTAAFTSHKQWDDATAQVQALQTEWRTIGFAPKKVNTALYEEYRATCDAFFAAKTAYYKNIRAHQEEALTKKQALVEKAIALKDSTDWKATTDKLVKLQAEWKTVGHVGKKYGDELWKQFSEACDAFFSNKKNATQGQHAAEKENLAKKQAIVAQIEALEITTKEETLDALQPLMQEYNSIGHVPFREKDKLYAAYKKACDRIFETLNVAAQNRRLDAFSKAVEGKDENALLNDRRRLMRQAEALDNEIKTAENNILFFSGNSKKGNKLVEDMERKIAQQKKQLSEIRQRIKLIDAKID